MIAIVGALVLAVSAYSFWYMLPQEGEIHWLMQIQWVEAYIPIVIISGAAVGAIMILSAFL